MRAIFLVLLLAPCVALALTPAEQEMVRKIQAQVTAAQEARAQTAQALEWANLALNTERERLTAAQSDNTRLGAMLDLAKAEQDALKSDIRTLEKSAQAMQKEIEALKPKASAYDRLRMILAFVAALTAGALTVAYLPMLGHYKWAAGGAVALAFGSVAFALVSKL